MGKLYNENITHLIYSSKLFQLIHMTNCYAYLFKKTWILLGDNCERFSTA